MATEDEDELDGPEWDDGFDADRARSLITELRSEAKTWKAATENGSRATIDSLRAEVKAARVQGLSEEQQQMLDEYQVLRDASQTDAERLQAQLEEAQAAAGQVPALTSENMRLKVAITKGVPPELAERLKGSTTEELEADADQLLSMITPGQARGMRPNPAQGTSGGGTGPTLDDQIVLARKDGNVKLAIRLEAQKLLSQQ